jgi:hypothetical protein
VVELNQRPRKVLNYETPYEVFFDKPLHLVWQFAEHKKEYPGYLFSETENKDIFLKYSISKIIEKHDAQLNSDSLWNNPEIKALQGVTPQMILTDLVQTVWEMTI